MNFLKNIMTRLQTADHAALLALAQERGQIIAELEAQLAAQQVGLDRRTQRLAVQDQMLKYASRHLTDFGHKLENFRVDYLDKQREVEHLKTCLALAEGRINREISKKEAL